MIKKINYDTFTASLSNLETKYIFFEENKNARKGIELEMLKDSLVQCFEICFDTAWKHIKKYLQEQGLVDIENTPKGIFREGFNSKIILDLDVWFDYTNKRNLISHNYNFENAYEILEILENFIKDTKNVLHKMIETLKNTIDLQLDEYLKVNEILQKNIFDKEVWAFGSRVDFNTKSFSDLDLVVFKSDLREVSNLKEIFEKSDLHFKVDVLQWEQIPEDFQKNIKEKYIVLQKTKD